MEIVGLDYPCISEYTLIFVILERKNTYFKKLTFYNTWSPSYIDLSQRPAMMWPTFKEAEFFSRSVTELALSKPISAMTNL